MSLEKVTLDSGLTIYHDRIAGEQVNSVKMFLPYGSVDEKEGDEGVAHVFEHCVHLETDEFAGRSELRKHATLNGMVTNANTFYTRTVYYADGLALEPNMVHLSQILQHTHLPEQGVAHELKAIRREAMTRLDNPGTEHLVAATNAIFGKPYGRSVIGYRNNLDFDAETLQQLHQRYYKLGRMSLIVSGKAKLDEVIDMATRYFHADDEPYDTSNDKQLPLTLGEYQTTGLVREDSQNVRMKVGYPMSPEFREQYLRNELAFDIAQSAISAACSNTLRHDKDISNNGSTWMGTQNHPNAWHISGSVITKKEDLDTAVDVFDDIFSRKAASYTDNDIAGELAQAKYILNLDLATVDKRTDEHIGRLQRYQEPQDMAVDRRKLAKLKVGDIRDAIDKITEYTSSTPKYTHLTGKRKAIGDVERIIERDEIA